jgi:single-strand DNA-binding protein
MNRAQLIGNIGADPVMKQGPNGPIAFFSVATKEQWTDRQSGLPKEDVQWHQIAVFEPKLAEFARDNLRKGSFVRLEGSIRNQKYQDSGGNDRFSSQIVVSGPQAVLKLQERQQSQGRGR